MTLQEYEISLLWRDILAMGIYRRMYDTHMQMKGLLIHRGEYRIPRIIHMIYLKGALPEFEKSIVESWKKFHPGWEVKLWTEKDVEGISLKNEERFRNAKTLGAKTNILKYELLESFGGLFVDLRVECLKAFDDLHKSLDFFVGVSDENSIYLSDRLIGASPHHPFLEEVVSSLIKPSEDEFKSRMEATGQLFFTKCFLRRLFRMETPKELEALAVFPPFVFFPYPEMEKNIELSLLEIKNRWVQSESYAICYW